MTEQGRIECDVVVNATGMWGARDGQAGRRRTSPSAPSSTSTSSPSRSTGCPRDLPTFRDPDARFYVKPETGGLVIGGWEDGTRAPWRAIPRDLGPELFPPDHERFEPLAEAAGATDPGLRRGSASGPG